MTAAIHYLDNTTARQRAGLLLALARDHAGLVADHSGQQQDRLKADLLAAIAADDLARAVAVLAGLTRHTNARSA